MKLVLLDRDGVINNPPIGEARVVHPSDLHLIEGAGEGIRLLKDHGFSIAVVTNQSIIGRGMITEEDLHSIHAYLQELLTQYGTKIDKIFFCGDAPHEASYRRKPGSGMLEEAIAYFGAEPERTPMVGDSLIDLQAAHAIGCPRYLVRTGHGESVLKNKIPQELLPVSVHENLLEATETICSFYR